MFYFTSDLCTAKTVPIVSVCHIGRKKAGIFTNTHPSLSIYKKTIKNAYCIS